MLHHYKIDECMKSFRTAAEFYADRFPDGIVKFRCNSWLLAPNHKDYLAPETNIRKFADLFDVVEVSITPQYGNWWRIFAGTCRMCRSFHWTPLRILPQALALLTAKASVGYSKKPLAKPPENTESR